MPQRFEIIRHSGAHSCHCLIALQDAVLLTVTLCILIVLAVAGWIYFRRHAKTGIPAGEVVYEDAGPRHLEAPLVSHRYGLTGKPDYLIETREGLVPVELKSAMYPRSGPYEAHVMQLLAYCVLVEDVLGARVPYGVLQYADRQHRVTYSDIERGMVLALIEEIRTSRAEPDVHRDHRHRGRCRACGYRTVCWRGVEVASDGQNFRYGALISAQ